MKEVTQKEFFDTVGPRDVHPEIVGSWPYTSIFRTRSGRYEVGRIVQEIPQGKGLPVSRYFVHA